ncbi:TM2 domain-containing protein [Candidatus Palauibacter sp.]|uniref:TM2 domain-containing protein n=1 Tax=Candidatus Palauibacter sp. TaxID=3101350 RepID=UPI003B02A7CC
MTEQPNDPGRAVPEGAVPPFAMVPRVTGPAQPSVEPSADADEKYSTGIGFGLWCFTLIFVCGIHRFYLGMYGTGFLWLLTFGLFGVGQFVDLFRMKRLVHKANVRDGYLLHPRQAHRLATGAKPLTPERKLSPAENRQQVLLRAAQANGGVLTVTQGVLASGLGFEEVEEVLREMVVKGHVDVDNAADSGVIVYRFPGLAGPFN